MRTGRSTRGAGVRRTSRLLTPAVGSTAVLGLLAVAPAGQAAAATPGWVAVNAPIPANGLASSQSGGDAVSSAAPGSCVSVGEYYVGAQSVLGADILSNGVWTAEQVPLPANALSSYQPYFRTLRCPSTTWCLAYGYYEDAAGHGQAFTSTWAGGPWTSAELPPTPTRHVGSPGTSERTGTPDRERPSTLPGTGPGHGPRERARHRLLPAPEAPSHRSRWPDPADRAPLGHIGYNDVTE